DVAAACGPREAPTGRRRPGFAQPLEMPDELLHEERIAARLPVDRVDRLRRELEAAPGCDELGEVGSVETPKADANRRAVALEIGEDLRQKVAIRELPVPKRADEEHSLQRATGELAQQEQGGSVCPVEVVENEQQRLVLGEQLDARRANRATAMPPP